MTLTLRVKSLFNSMSDKLSTTDALSLFLRMWVGKIFYTSGRTKVAAPGEIDPLLSLEESIAGMRKLTDDPSVFAEFEAVLTDDAGYYISELVSFAEEIAPNTDLADRIQATYEPSAIAAFVTPSENAVLLFQDEYQVPVISADLAAQLATIGETFLPILLFLGLATRFASAGLLVMAAVIQYVYPLSFADHIVWFAALIGILFMGPGKVSVDKIIDRQLFK